MQFSVETTEGLERSVSFTVPADQVDSEVKNRLKHLSKTQRMHGFRPGKVPVSVIQKRYGKDVRREVAGEIMQRSFYDAIMGEKITPAGMPQFEEAVNESGKDLEFKAKFEVYPEIAIAGLDEIKVERPVVEIGDADLEEMMETLRKQHATWEETEEAAAEDNQVVIDFVGTVDGEVFEGGKADDFALELGKGRMIPGFEDGIVGKKAGEATTVDVTFPEDYHAENLKGKAASFEITIKKVEAQKLPEIDEAFASLFGVADGGIEALQTEVRKNMQRELDQALKAKLKDQVFKGLLEANTLDVPKSAIAQEVDVLRRQAMQRFGNNVDPKNLPELPAELFEAQAIDRVKIGLLVGEVIKTNALEVEDDRLTKLIENVASAYEDPSEVVEYYKTNDQLMQQMRSVCLEEQALDLILEKAQVEDKPATFKEVMNPQEAA